MPSLKKGNDKPVGLGERPHRHDDEKRDEHKHAVFAPHAVFLNLADVRSVLDVEPSKVNLNKFPTHPQFAGNVPGIFTPLYRLP